jgi:hypothetical protein
VRYLRAAKAKAQVKADAESAAAPSSGTTDPA